MGIQLAKLLGAEVTAVDSGPKLALLRELGADAVLDYTQEEITRRPERYDVIFDVVGKGSFADKLNLLAQDGRYLLANPRPSALLRGWRTNRGGEKQVVMATSSPTLADGRALRELLETGAVRPVVRHEYPLTEIVAAHQFVESGQKMGSLIITIDDDERG
jgi:NADPH:quinone reductase-like Zn-dependent oxidoreductase